MAAIDLHHNKNYYQEHIIIFMRKSLLNTKKSFTLLMAMLVATSASFAAVISGKVTDEKGKPVKGASVSLDNTIDGGTTDSAGVFKFTTDEKGNQTIVATETSHATTGMPIVINGDVNNILLKMKTVNHNLEEVTISAGSFEASNDKNKAQLSTMDIITTAGAQADVVRLYRPCPVPSNRAQRMACLCVAAMPAKRA
jgi:vitamin B12 transporter